MIRFVTGVGLLCVAAWGLALSQAAALPDAAPPDSAGLWRDRLTPPNLASRDDLGEHLVLFQSGHFYKPFDPSQCQPTQTLVADYAGTWTRTEEGLQLQIVLERVLSDVTCLCAEDEDGVSVCEVSFGAEVVRRSQGKVMDGRMVGFSDGDQLYPTPGEGDDIRYLTAEILGKPYHQHALSPATPGAYFTLPGKPIHPEILDYFGCRAAADGKVSC